MVFWDFFRRSANTQNDVLAKTLAQDIQLSYLSKYKRLETIKFGGFRMRKTEIKKHKNKFL